MTWHLGAACTPELAHLFDPLDFHDRYHPSRRLDQAARICSTCSVTVECLRDARLNSDSGIRGGLLLDNGRIVPRRAAA